MLHYLKNTATGLFPRLQAIYPGFQKTHGTRQGIATWVEAIISAKLNRADIERGLKKCMCGEWTDERGFAPTCGQFIKLCRAPKPKPRAFWENPGYCHTCQTETEHRRTAGQQHCKNCGTTTPLLEKPRNKQLALSKLQQLKGILA